MPGHPTIASRQTRRSEAADACPSALKQETYSEYRDLYSLYPRDNAHFDNTGTDDHPGHKSGGYAWTEIGRTACGRRFPG